MPTTNSLNNQTQNSDFTVNKTTAGVGSYCVVNHLDGTNTANDAAIITQTTPGGGDSFHLAMVNGTRSMCWGMDVSDNYALKETTFAGGTGSPSFGTTIRKLTVAGEQTLPLQPIFFAYLSAADLNVTGAGATYLLGSGNVMTIVSQQGSGLATNGIFTAPVAGYYHFSAAIFLGNLTAAMTQSDVYFLANGATVIYGDRQNIGAIRTPTNDAIVNITSDFALPAGGTCRVGVIIQNGAGNTARVLGGAVVSSFTGYLIC